MLLACHVVIFTSLHRVIWFPHIDSLQFEHHCSFSHIAPSLEMMRGVTVKLESARGEAKESLFSVKEYAE